VSALPKEDIQADSRFRSGTGQPCNRLFAWCVWGLPGRGRGPSETGRSGNPGSCGSQDRKL